MTSSADIVVSMRSLDLSPSPRYFNPKTGEAANEVYLMFRIFKLGEEDVDMRVLVDLNGMRERGEVLFEGRWVFDPRVLWMMICKHPKHAQVLQVSIEYNTQHSRTVSDGHWAPAQLDNHHYPFVISIQVHSLSLTFSIAICPT